MYYVNKIVGWVMSPMGLLFLGLGFGMMLRRWRRVGRVIIGLTLAGFWVLGCGITTRVIGIPLEGREGEKIVGVGERGDAIVVLGGGVGIHEQCGRVELFSGADRVWMGAKLWKKYQLPLILGGGADARIEPLLSDFGIPRKAWECTENARNTEEEARLIKEKLTHHCPTPTTPSNSAKPAVLLVTSAWHMPRAKMLFERVGFKVVPVPTDFEMHYVAEYPIEFGDFFPSADALLRNSEAVKEWVARIGYAVFRR